MIIHPEEGTIIPPAHLKGKEKYLWNWRIPISETNQLLLIRNVILEMSEDN
jgi:hypothetical protein